MLRISKTIAQLRQQHELSQEAFAARLGVTKSYISKLEAGKSDYPPSDRFISRLAKEFNLDPYRLMLECGRIPEDMQRKMAQKLLKELDRKEGKG